MISQLDLNVHDMVALLAHHRLHHHSSTEDTNYRRTFNPDPAVCVHAYVGPLLWCNNAFSMLETRRG